MGYIIWRKTTSFGLHECVKGVWGWVLREVYYLGSYLPLLEKGRHFYPTWNVYTDNYVGRATIRESG